MNQTDLSEFDFLDSIQKNSIEDSIYGCMFGQIIGDALGAYLEFYSHITQEQVKQALEMPGGGKMRLSAGQITDDSEMALSLLRGLNTAENKEKNYYPILEEPKRTIEMIACEYGEWHRSEPIDIGMATNNALHINYGQRTPKTLNQDLIISNALKYNKECLSNGSLMRCSPLAVYFALCEKFHDFNKLKQFVEREASLTHSNPTAQAATTLWVYTIQQLILNHKLDLKERVKKVLNSVKKQYEIHYEKNGPDAFKDLWKAFQNKTLPDPKQLIGYLAIAWVRGLVLLQDLLDKPIMSFYELMKEVLNWGGDTDTNACIIGALFGAILGFDHFKNDTHRKDWVKKTLECKQRDNFRSNQVILETKILIDTMKINNKDQQKKDECNSNLQMQGQKRF